MKTAETQTSGEVITTTGCLTPAGNFGGSSTSLPTFVHHAEATAIGDDKSVHRRRFSGGEMDTPVKNRAKSIIPQINVEYVDRRSGTVVPDHEAFCYTWKCDNQSKEKINSADDVSSNKSAEEVTKGFFKRSPMTPHMQDKLQRKLKFYFMNPIEKWRVKRRFPYKLGVQAIKLVFVTIQLVIFAEYMSGHVTRQEDTKYSLRQIFLKNWDTLRDLKTYPPSAGSFAVFTKDQFYDYIDYSVLQYRDLKRNSVAPYSYDGKDGNITSMNFCKYFYKVGKVWTVNDSFSLDSKQLKQCIEIPPAAILKKVFKIQSFLDEKNFTIKFARLIRVELIFNIKSIFLKSLKPWDVPVCSKLVNTVLLDNTKQDGLIAVSMDTKFNRRACQGNIQHADSSLEQTILDDVLVAVVVLICVTSLVLCSRAIYRAFLLQQETVNFFKHHLNKTLPLSDRTEFLNLWYGTIIINDILITMGSFFKFLLHHQIVDSDIFTTCTIALGVGNLLMWSGILRYFGFFPKYNILILTLKKSVPDILRYMLCVLFLYAGYSICGWLVLGPYHFKFRTLERTSMCLFSLINGDDMFATFQMVQPDANPAIHFFAQIYFYSFITLFIYVVLSLFIAVIMESYEVIKDYYSHGFPKSMLMEFIAQCDDNASSSLFKHDSVTRNLPRSCLNCMRCRQDMADESFEEIIGSSDY